MVEVPGESGTGNSGHHYKDGVIKLVEMEGHMSLAPTANSSPSLTFYGWTSMGAGAGNTERYRPDGWITITWFRELSSECWRQDCRAYVSTSSILSQLRDNHAGRSSALKSLEMAGPLWTMNGGDVVYLMAKSELEGKLGWAIAFNIRNSTLDGVTSFQAERDDFFKLAYHHFALSKLTSSGNCRGTGHLL